MGVDHVLEGGLERVVLLLSLPSQMEEDIEWLSVGSFTRKLWSHQ